MRDALENLHDAWPKKAPVCASKHIHVSVSEPARQWVQGAYKASSLQSVHVKAYLLNRSLFSHHQEILRDTESGITEEWGPELEGGC